MDVKFRLHMVGWLDLKSMVLRVTKQYDEWCVDWNCKLQNKPFAEIMCQKGRLVNFGAGGIVES